MLRSTAGGKADDGGALGAGTEPAIGAGDSMRVGRTDHDGSPLWRFRVLCRIRRENYGNRCNLEISKLVCVRERVAADIYGEAVVIRFLDQRTIFDVRENVVVRERKATTAPVRFDQCSKSRAIDR